MKFRLTQNLSLRARFRVTMGIVLIPLIVVALGSGICLQHAANTLNKIVEQPVYKLQTTSRLQNVIRQAHASVKDYLNTGRYALRTQFESGAKAAEDTFIEILGKPFLSAQEYTLLNNVRHEWQESVATAMVIFAPNPPKMASYSLDQRVNQIVFALDQIQGIKLISMALSAGIRIFRPGSPSNRVLTIRPHPRKLPGTSIIDPIEQNRAP